MLSMGYQHPTITIASLTAKELQATARQFKQHLLFPVHDVPQSAFALVLLLYNEQKNNVKDFIQNISSKGTALLQLQAANEKGHPTMYKRVKESTHILVLLQCNSKVSHWCPDILDAYSCKFLQKAFRFILLLEFGHCLHRVVFGPSPGLECFSVHHNLVV